jgi:hypothetical protein
MAYLYALYAHKRYWNYIVLRSVHELAIVPRAYRPLVLEDKQVNATFFCVSLLVWLTTLSACILSFLQYSGSIWVISDYQFSATETYQGGIAWLLSATMFGLLLYTDDFRPDAQHVPWMHHLKSETTTVPRSKTTPPPQMRMLAHSTTEQATKLEGRQLLADLVREDTTYLLAKSTDKKHNLWFIVAFVAYFVLLPACVRIGEGTAFFGSCNPNSRFQQYEGWVCEPADQALFTWQALTSTIASLIMLPITANFILESKFMLGERLRLYERLAATLQPQSIIPVALLDANNPTCPVVFANVCNSLRHWKVAYVQTGEAVFSVIIGLYVSSVVLLLSQTLSWFPLPMWSSLVLQLAMPGYLALVFFIGKAALTTGVGINSILDSFPISFGEQAFSLQSDLVLFKHQAGDLLSQKTREAAQLWKELRDHLILNKDAMQFRFLEIAITRGLLASLASTMLASVSVYVYDALVADYNADLESTSQDSSSTGYN